LREFDRREIGRSAIDAVLMQPGRAVTRGCPDEHAADSEM
jgi:hypothetical protein